MRLAPKRPADRWLHAISVLAALQVTAGCGRSGVGTVARDNGWRTADAGQPRGDPPTGRVDADQRPDVAAIHLDASAHEDGRLPDAARSAPDAHAPAADAPAHDAGGAPDGGRDGRSDGGTDAPAAPPALCQIAIDCDKAIPNEPKITCALSLADGQGVSQFADHAGVELHGRSSLTFPKKNYSIELRDATGASKPTDLLQMGKESDWILDGMWADRSLMRNALAFDAFRELGGLHYAAKGRYCRVSLNGKAQGIYRLEEKIKRDDDRVAIAADDGTGQSFVIKQDSGGVATLSVGDESHWQLVYPNQEKATSAQLAGVQDWLTALGAAFETPNDPGGGLLTLLDRDATVDWMLLQEMMKNIDAYNLSVYLSRDAGSLARLIPWDFDLSLGQPTLQGDRSVPPNDQPGGWIVHDTNLWRALVAVPEVVERLGPRWRELRARPLATAALLARLDGYQVTLSADAVAQNFTLWPLGQINYNQTYPPYTLYPVSSYADEVAKLRAFLTARLAWIDAHIDAYPN